MSSSMSVRLFSSRAIYRSQLGFLSSTGTDPSQPSPNFCRSSAKRSFSHFTRGHDLLGEQLSFGEKPKVVLDSYGPSGFDVYGVIDPSSIPEDERRKIPNMAVHMNGSILALPNACFLWNVERPEDITLDSLATVRLHKPALEYLFIGSAVPLERNHTESLRKALKLDGIVLEQLDLANAMGTFNILNGEDRLVAAALLKPQDEEEVV